MELINQLPANIKEETKHFIQKVEERGIEKAKRKAVENMLVKNFPVEAICEIQEVSDDFVYDVQEKMTKE